MGRTNNGRHPLRSSLKRGKVECIFRWNQGGGGAQQIRKAGRPSGVLTLAYS
jgi:hypothetical protein